MQSTDEAITAGVPLIGLPMLWDQWFNVELYEIHDIGIKINFETLTEDKLKNAIYDILGDQRYIFLIFYISDSHFIPLC